jgi:hypothetical protein
MRLARHGEHVKSIHSLGRKTEAQNWGQAFSSLISKYFESVEERMLKEREKRNKLAVL